MNKKTRLAAVLVETVMAGHPANGSAEGMAYGRSQAPAPLEGSWVVTIRPIYCSGPNAGADVVGPAGPLPAVTSHLTFGRGGTLIETTANPALGAGKRTPGHGWWERTGRASARWSISSGSAEPPDQTTSTISP